MVTSPLEGVEVVEVCAVIAGPFAGKILAQGGANVTKVEPVGGELLRVQNRWYDNETHGREDFTYRFLQYNTDKDSIGVDLKDDAGKEVLWKLIEEADVVIENMRPGTFERLGFSWAEMHERNPELIYCSITGYGEDGAYSNWPAFDNAIQGVSGWAYKKRVDDIPRATGVIAIDHATAMYAATSVLMSLIGRGANGGGERIDIAMVDAAISFLGQEFGELSAGLADPEVGERIFDQQTDSIYRVADGFMVLSTHPAQWEALCRAIDREEFIEDHPFSTVDGRNEHADELRSTLEDILEQRTADEWIDHFSENAPSVICAPVNSIEDLPDDPHVRDRGLVSRDTHPVLGEYVRSRPAMRFSRYEIDEEPAPRLGADTDDILRALGYGADEIERLRADDVVS